MCRTPKTLYGVLTNMFMIHLFSIRLINPFTIGLIDVLTVYIQPFIYCFSLYNDFKLSLYLLQHSSTQLQL